MKIDILPPYPCYRCKSEHQCFTPSRMCTRCRSINGRRKDTFSPYDYAMQEMIAKYGEARARSADYACWESQKTDPELIAINKEMYARMAQLAEVETQSERTARTIEAQRAAQARKKERRRIRRLAALEEEDDDLEALVA